jgi:L-malate glycosyltransferase
MQYLKTHNVNLVKDMGMIPYKLHELYNYDSTVVTYKNDEYNYLNEEVKGLKIDFVRKLFFSYSIDGAVYLISKAKYIDVLQIFHITLSSVIYTLTYKLINKSGKVYLKLDCSHKLIERIAGLISWKYKFLNYFLNKVNLISVEQEELYYKIRKLLPLQENKIVNITNGVDFDYINKYKITYDYSSKENIILNVARIGAEEKNTLMLLEAFANIEGIEKTDWKLKLIGPIENNFIGTIEKYFARFPHLREKVIFTGEIKSRVELYNEYKKSKIFSLTSDFESFGIAFIEAAAFGNVIVSTDVGIARELVAEKNGKLVLPGDVNSLSEALKEFINNESLKELSEVTYNLCRSKYDWNKIIEKLHMEIMNLG